jgi:hypothetical protein
MVYGFISVLAMMRRAMLVFTRRGDMRKAVVGEARKEHHLVVGEPCREAWQCRANPAVEAIVLAEQLSKPFWNHHDPFRFDRPGHPPNATTGRSSDLAETEA